MDKAVLGFFTDVMYIKGIICFDEYKAIMDSVNVQDLGVIVDKMLNDEFNVLKRGEAYVGYNK